MLQNKNEFTSLELVELINRFREEEGNKKELPHNDFLKVIRDEFEEEIREGNISQSSQSVPMPNGGTREQPMYILNLHQSRQVLVRESKFVRRAVIAYIDKLEQSALPQDYPSALRALADQAERTQKLMLENKVQSQQIAELQPKATYYDLILQCPDLIPITHIAKDYGMSAKALNTKLHELGIQFNQSGTWLLYQKYADKGYTKTKTQNYNRTDGTQGARVHTYWTQQGRLFIYDTLKANGLLPKIEKE